MGATEAATNHVTAFQREGLPPYGRILVPLDGSPLAERAVELTTELAQCMARSRPAQAPLMILFRAVDPSPWLDLAGGGAHTHALEAAAHYLQEQAAGLRTKGLTVETAVRPGQPAAELVEQVLARQVDLVVLSTHGRSGLARWALGSVAERVARSAPVPVLLLPAAAPATLIARDAQGAARMPRLLVPLDRSAQAEAALPPALELAQMLAAEVHLLGVMVPHIEEERESKALPSWEAARRRLHKAEQYLLCQVQAAQQAGVCVHWSLGYGLLSDKIIAEAYRQQVHLIVMTTEGRRGQESGRLSEVVEAVIRHGRLPMLLVPSATAAPDPLKEDRSPGSSVAHRESDRSAALGREG